MKRLLKGVALFFVVTCLVWVAVLWRWQATSHQLTIEDIAVYLLLLPVTVFLFVLLAGWAWRGAAAREAARSSTGVGDGAGGASGAGAAAVVAGSDEAARHATVQLLGAFLATAAGASPSDLLSAAAEGAPRPAPDAALRDDDGMPILAARIPGLDADAALLVEEAEPHLATVRARRTELADASVGDHVWRALAALREPLHAAVDTVASNWPLTPDGSAPAKIQARADAPARPLDPPIVRVLVGWPLDWHPLEQEVGRVVVSAWLAERGPAVLPQARFAVNAQPIGGEALLLEADQLLQTLAKAGHDDAIVVAACHSTIGDDAVRALEDAGVLHHPQRRPKGRMPGEAACALVLASEKRPTAADASEPAQHLHRPALAVRDKSVDAPGKVGAQSAVAVLEAALAASRLPTTDADADAGAEAAAEAVGAVLGDADQHTERAAELYTAAAELLPQLDTADDVVSIGHVTGATGGVGALLVVACAAALAKEREVSCAALAVGDATARLALVVRFGPLPVAAAAGKVA